MAIHRNRSDGKRKVWLQSIPGHDGNVSRVRLSNVVAPGCSVGGQALTGRRCGPARMAKGARNDLDEWLIEPMAKRK